MNGTFRIISSRAFNRRGNIGLIMYSSEYSSDSILRRPLAVTTPAELNVTSWALRLDTSILSSSRSHPRYNFSVVLDFNNWKMDKPKPAHAAIPVQLSVSVIQEINFLPHVVIEKVRYEEMRKSHTKNSRKSDSQEIAIFAKRTILLFSEFKFAYLQISP